MELSFPITKNKTGYVCTVACKEFGKVKNQRINNVKCRLLCRRFLIYIYKVIQKRKKQRDEPRHFRYLTINIENREFNASLKERKNKLNDFHFISSSGTSSSPSFIESQSSALLSSSISGVYSSPLLSSERLSMTNKEGKKSRTGDLLP